MPRYDEAINNGIPEPPDVGGWRHWGDGLAGRIVAARIQGFSSGDADYRDIAVDSDGNLQIAATISSSDIQIGAVELKDGTTDDRASISAAGALKVDGSATTQPVSAASLPLPSGAATAARQDTGNTSLAAIDTKLGGTLAVSGPLTDAQLRAVAVPVSGTFWQTTQPVSLASVPSHDVTNAGTFAVQAAQTTASSLNAQVVGNVASGGADSGNPVKVGGVFNTTQPTLTSGQRGDVQMTSRAETRVAISANATMANCATPADAQTNTSGLQTQARLMSYNGATWDMLRGDTTNGLDVDVTRLPRAATATITSVNDSATNATLLSANANRLGATIYNDSDQALYVKLGTTATATDFTVKLAAGGYFELPGPTVYSGRIDGIWASDSTGAARVTELT